jgi:probable DNA metabolism protein
MRTVVTTSFDEWRSVCRPLLVAKVAPSEVRFTDNSKQLWLEGPPVKSVGALAIDKGPERDGFRVPPAFIEIARDVACHRDADRFDLLYRVLWRILHGEPRLLEIVTDREVHRLDRMQKAIARDVHKMHAFVRFRRVVEEGKEHFVAWHRPDHTIVRVAAPFFSRRFPTMDWSILTPDESVHWNQHELSYMAGVPQSAAPDADQLEGLWRTYYRSIFNPARLNTKTMKREMPVRHWKTLPEATELPSLIADARSRVGAMLAAPEAAKPTATDFLPQSFDLPTLAQAAKACRGCELCEAATQVVFGEGPVTASIVLVGEQPGDEEDLAGRPFVGPAGRVLDAALVEAGLERDQVYLTNAVKHFKFEQRGRRRLHQRPTSREVQACRPWFVAELSQLHPMVLVCLGATAVQSVMRKRDRLSDIRGQIIATEFCQHTVATYHPSAVLRAGSPERETEIRQALIADLRRAVALTRT